MKTQKLLLIFLLLGIISWPLISLARSGCCSYHGGVCGCGCCDGSSLSATCAPYYPECDDDSDDDLDDYYIPAPTKKITFPNPLKEVPLDYSVFKTSDDKFSVTFDWADHNNALNHDYSIRLAKTEGDPGPLVDTDKSSFTFTDIPAGTYVLSLKTKLVGSWTDDYVVWKDIYISEARASNEKPFYTHGSYTSQKPAAEPKCTNKPDNECDSYFTWAGWATLIAIILGISLIVVSNDRKQVEDELHRLKFPPD